MVDLTAQEPKRQADPLPATPQQRHSGATWYGNAVVQRRPGATTISGDIAANVSAWRAWREPGDDPMTSTLHVKGLFTLPAERRGSRVVLQEAVLSSYHHQQWDTVTGSGGGSPVLILERVIIPPSFDAVIPTDTPEGEASLVAVTFKKQEYFSPPAAILPGHAQLPPPPRYTHVTIVPDGVTLPIAS